MPYNIKIGGIAMSVKAMRVSTGLSQNKFSALFGIPTRTLQDWESGRRNPPNYVISMMWTILNYKGLVNVNTISKVQRQEAVNMATAIILTATEGYNKEFMLGLNSFIEGDISLAELEDKVDNLEFLGV